MKGKSDIMKSMKPVYRTAKVADLKPHPRNPRKRGDAEAPVIELDVDDANATAYMIADNQLTILGAWDFPALEELVGELKAEDWEGMGFLESLDLPDFASIEAPMPDLASGDKEPFQQMTFTLHDSQAEQVKAAMEAAKAFGPFVASPNENSNGNALARICETYLTGSGRG